MEDSKKIDEDPRHWKFEWHKVANALEGFSIGLLMTHEHRTEDEARAIVESVMRAAVRW